MTTVGSLCTGYGGIEMGLVRAGVDVRLRWMAEVEPTLSAMHGTPNLGDITRVDWTAVEPVDLLTAGFPCQPTSAAGRRLGDDDPRWLWPAVHDAVKHLRPARFLVENVRNLVSYDKGRLWNGMLDDLVGLGYGVRWLTLGACHVGAAHHRHRVFLLAGPPVFGLDVERMPTSTCGAKHGTVLPTPAAVSYGSNQGGAAGRVRPVRHSLESLAKLLPTPQATDGAGGAKIVPEQRTHRGQDHGPRLRNVAPLLPTPVARDGDDRQRGEGDAKYWARRAESRTNGLPLGAEVALLPTPTARDGASGAGHAASAEGSANLRHVATQPDQWGRFAEAVSRHAAQYGDPPAPTEPNSKGSPRLAPAFAEWLMCLPPGHVTSRLDRVPALRAIGNGVCPPQLAAAWHLLGGAS